MLKYLLIGFGLLCVIWLIMAIRRILAAVQSGEFERQLDAKRTLRELNRGRDLSLEDAEKFMNEYVAEQTEKAMRPINSTADKPEVAARYSAWLAVSAESPEHVLAALDVSNSTPCNWQSGSEIISSAMSNMTFAGSSIDGWVLLFGHLPEPQAGTPEVGLWDFLIELSKRFGRSQYFSCSTISDFYSWAKAENGRMARAFSIAGDTIVWNHGDRTPEETNAGIAIATGVRGRIDGAPNPNQLYDVDNPLTFSREWSVCPEDLYDREDLAPGCGVLFTLESLEVKRW